jgi:purine nucleosidase
MEGHSIQAGSSSLLEEISVLKLHIDTDLGGDIDDLCALAMVLNWPDAELLGVTTNQDDRGRRAGYTRYALGLAGREDVPVAAGADASLDCYRLYPGLPDEKAYWPEPIPPAPTSMDQALSLLERNIEQGGGYVFPPRKGFPAWTNEMDWNVQNDAQSARLVIERSNPTLVPMSVTLETWLRRAYLATLRRSGPLAQLIAMQAEVFARDENIEAQYGQTCTGLPEDTINFQHDPLTCAIALGWNDGVEIREIPLRLEIKDGWLWQRVDDDGRPTRVVTRVNGGRFSEFWLSTVAGSY